MLETIQKLQLVQKAAARQLTGAKYKDHMMSTLKDLHLPGII